MSEAANATLNASLPQAGPRGGAAGRTFGSAAFDANADFAVWLRTHGTGERWDLAVTSAMGASSLVAEHGLSVMALGGFGGQDPALDVAGFAENVAGGEVRFVSTSGGGPGGLPGGLPGGPAPGGPVPGRVPGQLPGSQIPGAQVPGAQVPGGTASGPLPGGLPSGQLPGGPGGRGTAGSIMSAVQQACTPVTDAALPAGAQGSLYDCAGKAAALAALATTDG